MKSGTITENTSVIASAGNNGVINTLYLWGDFGGGNVTVDITPDGSEYFDLLDKAYGDDGAAAVTVSEKGYLIIEVKTRNIRLTLAGATAPNVKWAVL